MPDKDINELSLLSWKKLPDTVKDDIKAYFKDRDESGVW